MEQLGYGHINQGEGYDNTQPHQINRQGKGRPEYGIYEPEQVQGIAPYKSQQAQEGIQDEYAGEVGPRTEVRYTLLTGRIIDIHGYRDNPHAIPGRRYQQLQLCLVPGSQQGEPVQFVQGIKPEARLGVGDIMQGLYAEPEVAESIGKLAAARPFYAVQLALTQNDGFGVAQVGLQEQGDVLGEMLTVGIQGNGIGEAHLYGLAKAVFQGRALACVLGIIHQRDALCLQEQLACAVGAAVVHYNNIVALQQGTTDHISNGSCIVVCRYNGADSSLVQQSGYVCCMLLFRRHYR